MSQDDRALVDSLLRLAWKASNDTQRAMVRSAAHEMLEAHIRNRIAEARLDEAERDAGVS